jgi:hypothetical protein
VPVGPFVGRDAILAAYRERPPDDQLITFRAEDRGGEVIALYGWLAAPGTAAGRVVSTLAADQRISGLRVTFEDGLTWS